MTPLIVDTAFRTIETEADRLAERNWRANRDALIARRDPLLDDLPATGPDDLTWVFARDGYLTCFEPDERWLAGCSVPMLAAAAMLKALDGAAGAACLLAPSHAAQVRFVLDRLQAGHALLCVVPDVRALAVILRCDDFSADIAAGRLWLAAGDAWGTSLARILEDTPGLPTPTRFIRMPDADGAATDRMIADAQRVFGEQNARRAAAIATLRETWAPAPAGAATPRVGVIARSTFRLWDDAGHALWAALTAERTESSAGSRWARFDPDAPAGSSPLALATAAAGADVLVAANLSRADAPRLVPDGLPWVTWVTTPRVPPFAAAGPKDRLLLADPAWVEEATRARWPRERVDLAGWPRLDVPCETRDGDIGTAPAKPTLALIADTSPLDAPDALAEFSSHGLLWEKIRRDVTRDPFGLPDDVLGYVRDQARLEGIAPETLDLSLFAERLVVPAYQQAIADTLISAQLPVRLHGAGWAEIPRFAAHAAGAVDSRAAVLRAVDGATALVHAWPGSGVHAIDVTGLPVLRRRVGTRREALVIAAHEALAGAARTDHRDAVPPLSVSVLRAVFELSAQSATEL